MRRFVLLTFALAPLCLCQDLRGPRSEASPPITVKVEMPPQNSWMRLVEVVVPGLIGAGIAFLGVWWTNRRNASENAANRAQQLELEAIKDRIAAEAKSRDNRWAFRKEVYL